MQRHVSGTVQGQQPVPVFVDLGFRNTIPPQPGRKPDRPGRRPQHRRADARGPAGLDGACSESGAPQVYLVAATSGLSLKDLRKNRATRSLPAVKSGNVFVIPDSMLTEGGPGIARALATIAHDLHPG